MVARSYAPGFDKFFFCILPAAWVGTTGNQALSLHSPTPDTPFGRVPTRETGTERAQEAHS